MKVLVVGSPSRTAGLVRALTAPNVVTCCASMEQARQELADAHGSYPIVFIDERDIGDSGELLAELQGKGRDTLVFGLTPGLHETASAARVLSMCAVETTENGTQRLRCALRCAARDSNIDPKLRMALKGQPLVFEYHAERKAG